MAELTKSEVCELLGVREVGGRMVAVLQCRQMMERAVDRLGEEMVRERRDFFLEQCRRLEGLRLVR